MENEKGIRGTVAYDTENSIILGDYLDILLNKSTYQLYSDYSGAFAEHCYQRSAFELKNSISKLRQYEFIRFADNYKYVDHVDKVSFVYYGGIRLPHFDGSINKDEGSGNIVIAGKPGSGKSTLAFQFAAACTSELNNGIAVYYSLDVDDKQLVKSMKRPEGGLNVNYLCAFPSKNETYDSSDELENVFRNSMLKDKDKNILPQIVMPSLIPRGISPETDAKEDEIFLKRIEEIQILLRAVKSYNQKEREKGRNEKRNPMVKLVVIDSLDVFGETVLHREEINRLFMLFKQYGIIGVFTLGVSEYNPSSKETVDSSAVMYQADVAIELKKEYYNNYSCSYFEITKSRYTQHVLGHHPYKIDNFSVFAGYTGDVKDTEQGYQENFLYQQNVGLLKKIVVLPSLHYRISGSENTSFIRSDLYYHAPEDSKGNSVKETYNERSDNKVEKHLEEKERKKIEKEKQKDKERRKSLFGISKMLQIMPNHFKERDLNYPQIITISGKSGLFKSDFAINALLSGIVDQRENGLIVRLGDRDAFAVRGVRLERHLLKKLLNEQNSNRIPEKDEDKIQAKVDKCRNESVLNLYERTGDIRNYEPNKYTLLGWSVGNGKGEPQLMEVTFKNGALLPEEFVEEICKIINQYKIRRVAFIDLKYIGSSYPFLVNSDTSGNLFLSAFVHIMRNYGVHVIMSSSLSELEPSDIELKKAEILADAILTCSMNKKDKSVYISGEGMITSGNEAVITTKKPCCVLRFCDGNMGTGDLTAKENHTVKLNPFAIKIHKRNKRSVKQEKQKKQEVNAAGLSNRQE